MANRGNKAPLPPTNLLPPPPSQTASSVDILQTILKEPNSRGKKYITVTDTQKRGREQGNVSPSVRCNKCNEEIINK